MSSVKLSVCIAAFDLWKKSFCKNQFMKFEPTIQGIFVWWWFYEIRMASGDFIIRLAVHEVEWDSRDK